MTVMPLKKQLYLRSLILLILLPALNSFGLKIFNAYTVSGNVSYESVASFISGAIQFIDVGIVFCGFGLYLRAFYEFGFKGSAGILGLNVLSALIPYTSAVVIVYLTTSDPAAELSYMLIYGALNYILDLVMLAAVAAVAAIVARVNKAAKKRDTEPSDRLFRTGCIWSAAIFAFAGVIQKGAATIMDIIDYGAPTTFNDYFYLISPYLTLIVYAIVGAFIAWFTGTFGMNLPEPPKAGVAENVAPPTEN